MKWVTWENVGIDRISSAWIIKKFIDTNAEFFFVKKGSDLKDLDGIPFDIPGATLSHKRGRCTFCTILKEYDYINDPVLSQICDIIDAADALNDVLPPPEAAGLEVIFRGLRKVVENDQKALEVGFIIMDSLYKQLSE
ncbi:MAG: chromate resistance protein [Syntrophomonadaceae bacterium]|nr:chromate resistance protein [Syntrophomonadaceae bacterium]